MSTFLANGKSTSPTLVDKVMRLKQQRNAIIVSHNYQIPEIQDIADFIGDSLELCRKAATTNADVIVFCGVHFMAETAAVLNPDRIVLLPDLQAGCGMASMITAEDVRHLKAEHPGAAVVCYVNSSAEVKAESDICCTSSNAVKVTNSIPPDQEIIFIPDQYLGYFVEQQTGRKMILYNGYCPTHVKIMAGDITKLKERFPEAEVLVHPEASTEAQRVATHVLSTGGMSREARESQATTMIVATENGMLYKLKKDNPEKEFIAACRWCDCGYMKRNTLEKVLWALEDLQPRIIVPPDVAIRARKAIERMLEIS